MCHLPEPLHLSFYHQPTLQLAQSLLGKLLLKETKEGVAGGLIVETEGYIGPGDRAAHSFNHRRTKRTEIMFGEAGYTYTYSMHTHCLFNVVSGQIDAPEAVLIRGVEPYIGQELMEPRRPKAKKKREWTNGPGKLTKALGITMDDYGHALNQRPLWIAPGRSVDVSEIAAGPRIGIGNAGEAKDYPWRFWIRDNAFVSR
ncbi:DNA-3-methyladenine glycosylase [Lentibacillus cibarius]|uniref:Putative 3-methyladenine DNA glycosylase n=1 Tax=Lentibacillus cibarius TaxID=2583219 RepID=A0A549YJP4_9BACI|nr:DNA-3-methyladenine glycosylase [Lentibacillus cibarius]TRM12082.1 DNA-3-methyladenine glycosylase [Lentibacillus cibarius]